MTKQKILILLLFFSLLTSVSCAQISIGIKTGYTNNRLNTNVANRVLTQNKKQSGLAIGFLTSYEINKQIGIEGTIELLQKNYLLLRTDRYKGVYEFYINSYMQIPLTIQLKIYEKKKLAINSNVGFYGAYWAFAKTKGRIPNIFNITQGVDSGQNTHYLTLERFSEKRFFNKLRDHRVEFGWIAGVGINYDLSGKDKIFIKYEYYESLTDQQKKYMLHQTPKFNETNLISVGWLVMLGSKNSKT